MDIYNELIETIRTTGFPIAITIYLLWERQTLIKEFTAAMNTLSDTIETLKTYVTIKKDN